MTRNDRAGVVVTVEAAADAAKGVARSILRHWYAGCALAGICASPSYSNIAFADVAHDAIEQADEVLHGLDAEQKGAKP